MEIPHGKNHFLEKKNNYSPRKKSFFPTFPEIPPELPIEIEEDEEEEIEIDLPVLRQFLICENLKLIPITGFSDM